MIVQKEALDDIADKIIDYDSYKFKDFNEILKELCKLNSLREYVNRDLNLVCAMNFARATKITKFKYIFKDPEMFRIANGDIIHIIHTKPSFFYYFILYPIIFLCGLLYATKKYCKTE